MSIRLMDATGTVVLDSVATEYEDSFCLETFGELCGAAIEFEPRGSKHFIIARVQTWDPKQPEKSFYSYYHAHHLNKILFQTQVWLEKKLIHRLHVLNPLTNTDIIGNVLYFLVARKTSKSANGSEKYEFFTRQAQLAQQTTLGAVPLTVTVAPPSPSVAKLPNLFLDPVVLNQVLHNHGGDDSTDGHDFKRPPLSPLPGLTSSEANDLVKNGWTMGGSVCAEAADDVLFRSQSAPEAPVRGRQNSAMVSAMHSIQRAFAPLSPGLHTDHFDLEKQMPSHKVEHSDSAEFKQVNAAVVHSSSIRTNSNNNAQQKSRAGQLKVSTGFSSTVTPIQIQSAGLHATNGEHNSDLAYGPRSAAIRSGAPMSPVSPMRMNRRMIPHGVITQHGESLSADKMRSMIPQQKRVQRRALSYMNSVSGTQGPVSPSIDVWTKNLRHEQLASARIIEEGENGFFYLGATNKAMSNAHLLVTEPTEEFEQSVAPVTEQLFYDAFLIATDNDFLETSRVRLLFKENAVFDTDAQLFEMAAYTGAPAAPPGLGAGTDQQLPCDVCFPTEAQLRHPNPWIRFMHQSKCYVLLILVMVSIVLAIAMPKNT